LLGITPASLSLLALTIIMNRMGVSPSMFEKRLNFRFHRYVERGLPDRQPV